MAVRRGIPRPADHGATAVEYALMVGFIAAVIVGAVTVLGTQTAAAFSLVIGSVLQRALGGSYSAAAARSRF
jgi:Flp pilus assembly pilin Flp